MSFDSEVTGRYVHVRISRPTDREEFYQEWLPLSCLGFYLGSIDTDRTGQDMKAESSAIAANYEMLSTRLKPIFRNFTRLKYISPFDIAIAVYICQTYIYISADI